ncbi:MAG: RIP metalloprotease RseP [Bacteroidales bacterium]|nr:RIP metalloprotease RseP [Bacteroidales bacterium]
MVALFKALQVILALSILIIVHEFGHYLFARIFGIRVEKFYLFFDVGGKALARWRWGETEFGIGWLPFGGYCKIAGMVDESMDMGQLKRDPQPWEFRSKPAWQRLFVLAGGVLFNFIFAIIMYSVICGIWGTAYISNRDSAVYPNDLAREMGFLPGDRILKLDDYEPEDFGMLQADLARREVRCATVLRGQDTVRLYIDQSMIGEVLNSPLMFDLAMPMVIDSVASSANADVLAKGDVVLRLDGHDARYLQDASPILAEHAGETVSATVRRGCVVEDIQLQVDTSGRIGILVSPPVVKRQSYDALSAIPAGLKKTGSTIRGYLSDLKMVFKPSTGAYKSVGSFIAIGQVFPKKWDWYQFINILALLSIMLGVVNLIPIPGLDGGHIVFTLYEMITGRKPSDKFLYIMQLIGMVLIFGLMFLAFGNDIMRLIR